VSGVYLDRPVRGLTQLESRDAQLCTILLTVRGAVKSDCIRLGTGCLRDHLAFSESKDSSHPEVQTPLADIKSSASVGSLVNQGIEHITR
jgi:hypothetical protein